MHQQYSNIVIMKHMVNWHATSIKLIEIQLNKMLKINQIQKDTLPNDIIANSKAGDNMN